MQIDSGLNSSAVSEILVFGIKQNMCKWIFLIFLDAEQQTKLDLIFPGTIQRKVQTQCHMMFTRTK